MGLFDSGNAPGFRAAIESDEVEILRSGQNGQDMASTSNEIILSSATDSGNTPTTTLRGGLVMGLVDASGKLQAYGAPSTDDGRDAVVGLLPKMQNMLQQGTAADRWVNILRSGMIKAGELVGLDYHVRAVLARTGFLFDGDTPEGAAFLVHAKRAIRKAANFTILTSQNGCAFISTANAVNFTLPTIARGLSYEIWNGSFAASNNTVVVTGSSNICFGGSKTVSTLTGTGGGAVARIRAEYISTTELKWLVDLSGSWA